MKYIALGTLAVATGAMVLVMAVRPETRAGHDGAGMARTSISPEESRRDGDRAGGHALPSRRLPVQVTRPAAPRIELEPSPEANSGESVRAGIERELATAVATLRTEADVDDYLTRLIERAERKQRVSAVEVEPGLAAIGGLVSSIGLDAVHEKQVAFARRMETLSARLDGRPETLPSPPSPGEAHR